MPEGILQVILLTGRDWSKVMHPDPIVKLAIQYPKYGVRKPVPQVLADPICAARYLKDWDVMVYMYCIDKV